ncbi:MAG: glycosyltransferase family 61 protein [Gammaproteobacteria bacterium]|nr:glycosyltransferase family 61 protein [Gammaproteobacteria bacterium]
MDKKKMIKYIKLFPKVIQSRQLLGKSQSTLSRLKITCKNYLRRYIILRRLYAQRHTPFHIYNKCLAIYFYNVGIKRWRTLIKLSKFVETRKSTTYKLVEATVVETPKIKALPTCDQSFLVAPHERYSAPEVFVTIINNGMVYGQTNLVLVKNEVIHHDLYNFEHDYTNEEYRHFTYIHPASNRIRWLSHDKKAKQIEIAASFVDACGANYSHWLTEVLSRVAVFCSNVQFSNIPIIVNDGLHKNIMESLRVMAGADRKIITLSSNEGLRVKKLYLTSVAGYIPYQRRSNGVSGHSHGMFNSNAFALLLKQVNHALVGKFPGQVWPKKVLLRRNSRGRAVTNMAEIEKALLARGYTIVEPEKLTFLQQVKLFSQAEVIVGSSGAALANILFASKNVKIFILIGKYANTCYWYWQNIACASGKTVNYVLGKILSKERGNSRVHADFTIDLACLLRELDEIP